MITTTRGWLKTEFNEHGIKKLAQYSGDTITEENVNLVLARLAYSSVADTIILPLQDLLDLDETARMNKPSTDGNNWQWRLLPQQLGEAAETQLRQWMETYNRG